MPIIRALASAVSKRAILEFLNDWDREVKIEGALVATEGEAGTMMQLLEAPVVLKPGKSASVDVTAILGNIAGRNEALDFTIQLVLNPEPPTQPQHAHYTARFVSSGCEYFGRPRGF